MKTAATETNFKNLGLFLDLIFEQGCTFLIDIYEINLL